VNRKQEAKLVIRDDSAGGLVRCAICGEETRSRLGLELFREGTQQRVCWGCGRRLAPNLVDALRCYHHNEPRVPTPEEEGLPI